MIAILDYGAGNMLSVQNMLRKAGAIKVVISKDSSVVEKADKLILPGVGHFDYGMKMLNKSGLIPILKSRIFSDQTPVLGICLGAQLMTQRSDEGKMPGLGWIDGETIAFDKRKMDINCKIPHMGWNYVKQKKETPLFQNMYAYPRFYFVHSFHLKMDNTDDIWLTSHYGYEFCAAYQKENIYACQFHPEKSHKFGLQLMENFVAL